MEQKAPVCRMEYKVDEQGREMLLKDGKFQVMMAWEKPYMDACIDALNPFGAVLEVGFGLGYSAERIQSYHPESHTIIEYHPEVAQRAREWAKNYPHVTIIEGMWQDRLEHLGVFDAIFFDDYPLHSEDEVVQMQQQSAYSEDLLRSGAQLMRQVEKEIPFLHTICYADEDLADFLTQIPDETPASQVVRFFLELFSRQQISSDQLNRQLQRLVTEHRLTGEEVKAYLAQPLPKSPFLFSDTADRCYQFLSRCLLSHMKVGSRFSCFLSSATSKFEDQKFFNEIISNPLLDFHEQEISLEVPSHCTYFTGNKALVITITKQG